MTATHFTDSDPQLSPLGKVWNDAMRTVACRKIVERYSAGDETASAEIRVILATNRHPSYVPMCEAVALHHFGITHR